jgi:hypothetical protein
LTLSESSVSVAPGTSATVTLSTELTGGEAEPVTFTATGVPAGVSVTFDPATVTAGESTTVTVTAGENAGSGVTSVTLKATTPSVTHAKALSVGVSSAPGCSGTNTTPVAIPDNTTVTSSIVITGCAAAPSATSSVDVHILHTYIGDLVVSLVAPDGTAYVLQSRVGGSADNLDKTFTVNLSAETANGPWTLRVQDAASIDTGTLTSWSLSL